MTKFLIYLIVAVELLMLGVDHLIQWRINNKRRKDDLKFFALDFLLFLSFLFYGIESAHFNPKAISFAQTSQLVIDLSLSVFLGTYFVKKLIKEYKKG